MKDKVSKEEREYNISIDSMCSWCGAYSDVIIPEKVKLCSKCYLEMERGGEDD